MELTAEQLGSAFMKLTLFDKGIPVSPELFGLQPSNGKLSLTK